MKWLGRRGSGNVEDQRGGGGAGKGLALGGVGTIILVIIGLLMGKNPLELLNTVQNSNAGVPQEQTYTPSAEENEAAEFVKVVLADTEDVWNKLFEQMGEQYKEPKLVLFTGQVQSACGAASSASGPFYCPGDDKVYIDLSFYNDLQTKFNAPGDFAMAYVIAHEVGHHIQNITGTSGKMEQMRGRLSEEEFNKLSVKLELQADFLAGVWAHHAQQSKQILESGDIEEALNAANAIGDDRLQKQSQGYIVPDAFTHGTSAQRMYWFKKGFDSGDINQGDTFSDRSL